MKRSPMPAADPEKVRVWRQRSKPLARTAMRRTPRRTMQSPPAKGESNRRAKEARWEVQQRSGGVCEACVSEECREVERLIGQPRSATEMHHRRTRAHGGPNTAANLADLCAYCHSWVHAHPSVSYRMGLLVRSTDPVPTEPWVRADV